ncbi:MAG TPA: pyridoxamine 5'-phosphate oxidase family protein [Acidimicrobiales bacterium]|nr:pyridoxamine 5'-phosphate oxidase family protein [Acidimicrobiales bacterium]
MNEPLIDNGLEVLSEDECLRLLGGAALGRVAVTIGALPAVFPVNYSVAEGTILFKTAEGTKLTAALRNAVVAFEVDWADRQYHEGWSVLAIGTAGEIGEQDRPRFEKVAPRPWARGERNRLIGIRIEFVSGRRIRHDLPADLERGGFEPAG